MAVGADVPPELLADPAARFPPVLLIRGARDEWYAQQKLDADVAALTARGISVTVLVIDAGHEWTEEVSAAAARFLSAQIQRRSARS
jgi:predicted esterase